ncbi:MAG: translation initiation factor IF-1 [Candidatus Staskawiczbacteria bacterium]|nr:translation initiation factor IF-1 [Candidatus Staskawiczbacteria bacterium]
MTPNEPGSTPKNNQVIKKDGRVTEALPNAFFKVVLSDGKEILGFLSGKMRMNRITILPGDKVSIEMSPYDESKGRIVYRLK